MFNFYYWWYRNNLKQELTFAYEWLPRISNITILVVVDKSAGAFFEYSYDNHREK